MSPSPFWPWDSAPSKSCQDLILPQPRMCLISCLAVWFSALACCLSRNTHKHFRHPIKSQLTLYSHNTKTLSIYPVTLKKDKTGEQQTKKNTQQYPPWHSKVVTESFPSAFFHPEKCWLICWKVGNEQEIPTLTRTTASFKYPLLVLVHGLQGFGNQRAADF